MAHESARNRWKSSHSNRSKAVLVLSLLKFYHNIFWGASLLRRLLDHIRHSFQGRYLANDFFKRQVSCASPTNPFLRQLQCRWDIEYEYWKWSALRYITSLPCKTKPRVGNLSKSRWNPCWTSKTGWYKDHKLLAHACMVWAEKIACETRNLIIMAFFVLNGFVTWHLPQICISLPFLFCNLLIYCMHIEDKGYR